MFYQKAYKQIADEEEEPPQVGTGARSRCGGTAATSNAPHQTRRLGLVAFGVAAVGLGVLLDFPRLMHHGQREGSSLATGKYEWKKTQEPPLILLEAPEESSDDSATTSHGRKHRLRDFEHEDNRTETRSQHDRRPQPIRRPPTRGNDEETKENEEPKPVDDTGNVHDNFEADFEVPDLQSTSGDSADVFSVSQDEIEKDDQLSQEDRDVVDEWLKENGFPDDEIRESALDTVEKKFKGSGKSGKEIVKALGCPGKRRRMMTELDPRFALSSESPIESPKEMLPSNSRHKIGDSSSAHVPDASTVSSINEPHTSGPSLEDSDWMWEDNLVNETNDVCRESYSQSIEEMLKLTNYSYLNDPPECIEPVQEYNGTDDVEFLNDYNAGPRVVLFYAPWCPYSAAFKQPYISFARIVTELVPAVRFYAISIDAYSNASADWNVTHVPTLMVLRPGYPMDEDKKSSMRIRTALIRSAHTDSSMYNETVWKSKNEMAQAVNLTRGIFERPPTPKPLSKSGLSLGLAAQVGLCVCLLYLLAYTLWTCPSLSIPSVGKQTYKPLHHDETETESEDEETESEELGNYELQTLMVVRL